MAVDSNIGSLPAAASIEDDSFLVAEQQGEAKHITGKQLKDYVQSGIEEWVNDAKDAARLSQSYAINAYKSETSAAGYSEDARFFAERAEAASSKVPTVTTQQNGMFLRVVDGRWRPVALTDVSEVGV